MSGSGTTATRGGLLALVAIFATLVFGATAQAATINVNIKNVDSDTPTLEANCLAGSGDCPLRAAVIAANTGPDTSNTIVLPPGTYSLKGDGGDTLGGALHAVADRTLTIQGSDARTTAIDAAGLDRVLFAEGGSTVNVSGVTLRNGTSGSRIEFSNPVDLPTAQGLAGTFPT